MKLKNSTKPQRLQNAEFAVANQEKPRIILCNLSTNSHRVEKGENEKEGTTVTQRGTLGLILEALALPILITVAIMLNIPEKNLDQITILLGIGIILFVSGFMLRYALGEDKKKA